MIKINPNHGFVLFTLAFFVFSSTLFAQMSGTSFSKANETKTAKLYYVYDGVTGFAEKKNGQVTGFLVDIMTRFEGYVKENHGISITSEYYYSKGGDFQVFMADIKAASGGVFGLSNISIKPERKKIYEFSEPYLENASVLLTNSSVPTLQSMEGISSAFAGMTAYTLEASTYSERLKSLKESSFPALQITYVNSGDEILARLESDPKAFAFLDLNYYLEVLKAKKPIKRHAVGDLKDDQYGIVMPKGCDWQPVLNEFLKGFIGTTAYSEVISKHLGGSALRLIYSVSN